MLKITQSAISQRAINQTNKQTNLIWVTYVYTLLQIYGSKIQNTNAQKSLLNLFDISKITNIQISQIG